MKGGEHYGRQEKDSKEGYQEEGSKEGYQESCKEGDEEEDCQEDQQAQVVLPAAFWIKPIQKTP